MFLSVKSFFTGKAQKPSNPVIQADLAELEELTHQALENLSPAELRACDYLMQCQPGWPYVSPYDKLCSLYEPGSVEWQQFYNIVKQMVRCFHVDSTGTVMVRLELKTGTETHMPELGVF